MKVINYTLMMVFVMFIFSCSEEGKLFYSHNITVNFEKHEISDLYKILNSFDKEVNKIYGGKNLEESYYFFIADFKKNNFHRYENWVVFRSDKQKILLNSVSKSTFDKIWVRRTAFRRITNDSIGNYFLKDSLKVACQDSLKYLDLNLQGKYIDFLRLKADKDPNLKYYIEMIDGLQTATDWLAIDILLNNKISEIIKDEMRLIIVIQFLIVYDDILQNTLF